MSPPFAVSATEDDDVTCKETIEDKAEEPRGGEERGAKRSPENVGEEQEQPSKRRRVLTDITAQVAARENSPIRKLSSLILVSYRILLPEPVLHLGELIAAQYADQSLAQHAACLNIALKFEHSHGRLRCRGRAWSAVRSALGCSQTCPFCVVQRV